MDELQNLCPRCREPLERVTEGDFDTWECPAGHGVGLTLTESWGHFQDDEVQAIWAEAKKGHPTSLLSPLMGEPMVAISLLVDDDEVVGNEGPNGRLLTMEVAKEEQFLWFQIDDLANMPTDLPNPEPSPDEVAQVAEITKNFGDGLVEASYERDQNRHGLHGLANRFADKFYARRAAGTVRSRIQNSSES